MRSARPADSRDAGGVRHSNEADDDEQDVGDAWPPGLRRAHDELEQRQQSDQCCRKGRTGESERKSSRAVPGGRSGRLVEDGQLR